MGIARQRDTGVGTLCLFNLMSGSEFDEAESACVFIKMVTYSESLFNIGIWEPTRVLRKMKFVPALGIEPDTPGPRPSRLSTKLSLHLIHRSSGASVTSFTVQVKT